MTAAVRALATLEALNDQDYSNVHDVRLGQASAQQIAHGVEEAVRIVALEIVGRPQPLLPCETHDKRGYRMHIHLLDASPLAGLAVSLLAVGQTCRRRRTSCEDVTIE